MNLSATDEHTVTVQAGPFAEHDIAGVRYTTADGSWTGSDKEYLPHDVIVEQGEREVAGPWLDVRLPAGTQIELTLDIRLRTRTPSYRTPWS
jgi:hypothetical protein